MALNFWDKAEIALVVDAAIKANQPQPELSSAWPFRYGHTIFLRMCWSMWTIIYINDVLFSVFDFPEAYLNYLWCVPLGFVPLLGRWYLPAICAILMWCGVPSSDKFFEKSDAIQARAAANPSCYTQACLEYIRTGK